MKKYLIILVLLIGITFIGCEENLENSSPEKITEYIFKELAKTNITNVEKYLYNSKNINKFLDKKIRHYSKYYSGIVENPNDYEIKIISGEDQEGQYTVKFEIRNKTANERASYYRTYIKDRKNWSKKYDIAFIFRKENGQWKLYH